MVEVYMGYLLIEHRPPLDNVQCLTGLVSTIAQLAMATVLTDPLREQPESLLSRMSSWRVLC